MKDTNELEIRFNLQRTMQERLLSSTLYLDAIYHIANSYAFLEDKKLLSEALLEIRKLARKGFNNA